MRTLPPLPFSAMQDVPVTWLRDALVGKVELAVLFGSVAAGRTHAECDIDLAFWPLPGADLDRLTGEMMSVLGTDRVDVADLRRGDGLLQWIVASRGCLVYQDRPGRFAEFAARAERRWQDERHRLPFLWRAIDLWFERRGIR